MDVYIDSNPHPSEQESYHITTRPGLLHNTSYYYSQNTKFIMDNLRVTTIIKKKIHCRYNNQTTKILGRITNNLSRHITVKDTTTLASIQTSRLNDINTNSNDANINTNKLDNINKTRTNDINTILASTT